MVSQSVGRRDSPADLWEGISHDTGSSPSILDTDHRLCQVDIRVTRHKAAWINPLCVQQQMPDLPLQVPKVGTRGNHFVMDAASPLGPSPSSLGGPMAETSLSENSVASKGSGEKNSHFFTSTEEPELFPAPSQRVSLLKSPEILASSPCPETDSAVFESSHLTASADEALHAEALHFTLRVLHLRSELPFDANFGCCSPIPILGVCDTPSLMCLAEFVKRLRYCEYLGKYFCDCCYSYAESCIPARILMMWDFRKYHVSNFSKKLLDSIWHQPIFNLLSIGQNLYAKVKELDRVKDIQEQLFHIKKLLKTCRFAASALKEFKQVPRHLTEALHVFSLEDLLRTKRGLLAPLLKDILKAALAHVASCELCQGKGFICEFCRSTTVIFPFQTATCRRCSACRACFHKQCFQSSRCPRCARITTRRRLLESLPSAAT
ncbi:protein associated with UVRAG as autophagy enhancer [Ictidomys tridecemlineatus]